MSFLKRMTARCRLLAMLTEKVGGEREERCRVLAPLCVSLTLRPLYDAGGRKKKKHKAQTLAQVVMLFTLLKEERWKLLVRGQGHQAQTHTDKDVVMNVMILLHCKSSLHHTEVGCI